MTLYSAEPAMGAGIRANAGKKPWNSAKTAVAAGPA
jgi:hypothetical protein